MEKEPAINFYETFNLPHSSNCLAAAYYRSRPDLSGPEWTVAANWTAWTRSFCNCLDNTIAGSNNLVAATAVDIERTRLCLSYIARLGHTFLECS